MKNIKLIIAGLILMCATSCATPIDHIIPTRVPIGMEQVLDHDVPNWKGITTVGILKIARTEMEYKMKIELTMYNAAMEQSNLFIAAGEEAGNNLLGAAAMLGLGGAPIAFLAGNRRKRKGDLSPEEADLKIKEAGLKDPEVFKKENNI